MKLFKGLLKTIIEEKLSDKKKEIAEKIATRLDNELIAALKGKNLEEAYALIEPVVRTKTVKIVIDELDRLEKDLLE